MDSLLAVRVGKFVLLLLLDPKLAKKIKVGISFEKERNDMVSKTNRIVSMVVFFASNIVW